MGLVARRISVDFLVAPVFLLDGFPLAKSQEVDYSPNKGGKNDDSHNNPNRNANLA